MTIGLETRREPEPAGEAERQPRTRLDGEAAMLAVAEADLEAGRVVADIDVDAWLDTWARGEDVRLPEAAPKR